MLLLLLIGAVALMELFSEAGGKFPDDVVKPDIKPKMSYNLFMLHSFI